MNLIKSSLSNLKGHKLRVAVTLLWIIMGITSVILVSSIGNGMKKEVADSVNKVNPNKTRISFEPADSNMMGMNSFLKPFAQKDLEDLSFIEGVERIGPSKDDFDFGSTFSSDASFDKKSTFIEISELKKDSKVKAMHGRNFSFEDEDRKVIMITVGILVSVFGALNGYLLTGPRIAYTLAEQKTLPGYKFSFSLQHPHLLCLYLYKFPNQKFCGF